MLCVCLCVLLFLLSLALWEESSVVGDDSTVGRRRQRRDGGRSSSVSRRRYGRLTSRESLATALREHAIAICLSHVKLIPLQNIAVVVWGNVPIGRELAVQGLETFWPPEAVYAIVDADDC